MKHSRFKILILLFVFCSLTLNGCVNPFAPEEGDLTGDVWDNQLTVGGMLRNFQTSYSLRDSLRYSEIIADEFVFQYFDVFQERYDQWYRETELKTTGGLMRAVDRLDLRWGALPTALDTFAQADTTVEFTVNFSLTAGDFAPMFGVARFQTRTDENGKFVLLMWRDDY